MTDLKENIKKMYDRLRGENISDKLTNPIEKGKTKTFILDEDQVKKLEEWQSHIKAIYGEYGNYDFIFRPTGIGDGVEVYSHLADVSLDLTDVSKW